MFYGTVRIRGGIRRTAYMMRMLVSIVRLVSIIIFQCIHIKELLMLYLFYMGSMIRAFPKQLVSVSLKCKKNCVLKCKAKHTF